MTEKAETSAAGFTLLEVLAAAAFQAFKVKGLAPAA